MQGHQGANLAGAPPSLSRPLHADQRQLDKPGERLFAEVTERCLQRGSQTAVRALEKAMLAYLDHRNKDPKPFLSKADADLILGKVERLSKRISDQDTRAKCVPECPRCANAARLH